MLSAPITVHGAFLSAAARNPAAPAVEHDAGTMSYGELNSRSGALAAALRSLSDCGDRIVLMLGNDPSFLISVLAASRAGLVVVPIPPRPTGRELAHFLDDSGARVVITTAGALERAGDELEARAREGGVIVLLWDQPFRDREAATALTSGQSLEGDDVSSDDPFFIGYTSGTTGTPKGALVSQRARTMLSITAGQEYGCYHAGSRSLVATPLYHGAGLNRGLTPILTGGTVVLHRGFDAERVDSALSSGAVDSVFMVPTMFASIFNLGQSRSTRAQITIMSNAAALPEPLKRFALSRWVGARLFEIYGTTEGGTISSLRPEDLLKKPRSVGQALALTEIRISDKKGRPVERGAVGELSSRSPYSFVGYWNRPEATEEAVSSDGYVTSHDLARVDDDGFIYIVGRRTDTIVTGGVNVYPKEIEEVIRDHPAVADVVVIGIPDAHWGERVHAVIIPTPGATVSGEDLDAHCRRLISSQKLPKDFEFRNEVPRTSTGKIIRSRLVEEIVASQASESE
jgi:long-chain acyl-CoA synthetase